MQRERTHTIEIIAIIYRDMGIYIKEITANLLGILKKTLHLRFLSILPLKTSKNKN